MSAKYTISQNLLRYGPLVVFSSSNKFQDHLVAEVITPHAETPSMYGQLKNAIIAGDGAVENACFYFILKREILG